MILIFSIVITCSWLTSSFVLEDSPAISLVGGMEVLKLISKTNRLEVELYINIGENQFELGKQTESQEYVINGATIFQIKVLSNKAHEPNTWAFECINYVLVRFAKKAETINSVIFSSKRLKISNRSFISDDDGTWHLISENRKHEFKIDVTVVVTSWASPVNTFADLHNDEEIVDFELRGDDGAVRMPRAVMAAASPVLRSMDSSGFKEKTEGHADIPGTSKITLQHFKDYMYLGSLPDTGLDQLLLLAMLYMMPDLEQKCICNLVNLLTPENACDMLDFAVKHKAKKLLFSILECVRFGGLDIDKLREYIYSDDIIPKPIE